MFLKSLKIENNKGLIREIFFHAGLNLIIDETEKNNNETGNNVGKTAVLQLIDFCLGGKPKSIYTEAESKKEIKEVKDFLIDNNVIVTLVLTSSFTENAKEIEIKRNFLSYSKAIRLINGYAITEKEYDNFLSKNIFNTSFGKPTFRQIISHNIRCDSASLSNTLRTVNHFTSDIEYETLHLFMFGCNFESGEDKQKIISKISIENSYKNRIEKDLTKSALFAKLQEIDSEISSLNEKKAKLRVNADYYKDMEQLNELNNRIDRLMREYNQLNIRKSIIEECISNLNSKKSEIDTKQLSLIYNQAKALNPNIQKTFEELVEFHNQMLENKKIFISSELASLNEKIASCYNLIEIEQKKKFELNLFLTNSIAFDVADKISIELSEKYKEKGAIEEKIHLISEIESNLATYEKELDNIEKDLFSEEQQKIIQDQLNTFNRYFSSISKKLYNESYAIQTEIKTKNDKQYYKFSVVNLNPSTGKKQGEGACFDLAYIKFANKEKIPHLNFVLNDKKELMHDNQLYQIGLYLKENNDIQYVASFLKDKLPEELNTPDNVVLRLSQKEKLFKF